MINRQLNNFLTRWKTSTSRLPLILRGARQVGKTTLINEFAKSYDQYLYFNLEKAEDARLFVQVSSVKNLVTLLFVSRNLNQNPTTSTLIFIDEIQESPAIIELLRYFHEDYPHLHIIVSGSLLDFALKKLEKTPVGRVEYAELHPLSFKEYLLAVDKSSILELLENQVPVSNEFLPLIFNLFNQYAMIGGMPMIVKNYLVENDLTRSKELFNAILEVYKSDVNKYAKNQQESIVIRHIIDIAPSLVDQRINMANFGNLHYKSKEIKEGLNILQQARILTLAYPSSNTEVPVIPDYAKRPRLHFLDIGLINYQLGLQTDYLKISDLNHIARGSLVQQIVNQEIKAQGYLADSTPSFWARDEKGTSSEVDILFQYRNLLIPIEVKSGATGTLRSLHEFMDRCNHTFAVRIYGGQLKIDDIQTRKGKSYKLLNLPYFLSGWLELYLNWFVKT